MYETEWIFTHGIYVYTHTHIIMFGGCLINISEFKRWQHQYCLDVIKEKHICTGISSGDCLGQDSFSTPLKTTYCLSPIPQPVLGSPSIQG